MAHKLRPRARNDRTQQSRVIYDDPTLVPFGKMSFAVSQWKTIDENGNPIKANGKWTSNLMGFSYLQNQTLWLQFPVAKTNFFIPKTWEEVATTTAIHKEMVEYHEKYKYNVPLWIWNDFQVGLRDIESPASYHVKDIGITDTGKFVEIIEIGRINKCQILDEPETNRFYTVPAQIVSIDSNKISILLSATQRQPLSDLESLWKAQAVHFSALYAKKVKGDAKDNKQKLQSLRDDLGKVIKKQSTGRKSVFIDCTKESFYGADKFKSLVTNKIGGEWRNTKCWDTLKVSNNNLKKMFGKKCLKNKISDTHGYEVEDSYSYLKYNKKKGKLYVSINTIEKVGGIIKGSQKKRDEILKQKRKKRKKKKKQLTNSK